jgi:hypothetical protein
MNGPPNESEGRAPHHQGQPSPSELNNHHITGSPQVTAPETLSPGSALVWLPCTWTHPQDVSSQLRRRRNASYRRPELEHIGRSDPWHFEPPTAGYEDAAAHLLSHAPDPEGLREMWKRGGHERLDAETIAERWGLVA